MRKTMYVQNIAKQPLQYNKITDFKLQKNHSKMSFKNENSTGHSEPLNHTHVPLTCKFRNPQQAWKYYLRGSSMKVLPQR